jgi:hypothetical protein
MKDFDLSNRRFDYLDSSLDYRYFNYEELIMNDRDLKLRTCNMDIRGFSVREIQIFVARCYDYVLIR